MSLRYCPTGPWRATRDYFIVWDGDVPRVFTRGRPPPGVQRIYEEILDRSGLECRPRLMWLNHLDGAGGYYLGNVIAVGAGDVRAIARELVEGYLGLRVLSPYESFYYRGPRYSLETFELEVIRCLLAHEVGHALSFHTGQSQGVSNIREELQADAFAGAIAESMGWDPELQRLIFHAIGCLGPTCTHPTPEARSQAYEYGRTLY